MANDKPSRISQSEFLRHLSPYMGRSSWYAGPRRTMVHELDIRISPRNGRVTLDRRKAMAWLETLAGHTAYREATRANRQPRRFGAEASSAALDSLAWARQEGRISQEAFLRAVRRFADELG
jgi:hypothetical protein